jgi:anti-sigma B factor antagonist
MSMKANILRDAQGNIVVQMEGDLNYELSIPLRQELTTLATKNPNTNITIDLSGIDFVGSSGICHFVETLKLIRQDNQKTIKLSNVQGEFIKVFKLYSLDEADFLAEQLNFDTDETENMNYFGDRNRTFEN